MDNVNLSREQMRKAVEARRIANQQKHEQHSKEQLTKHIKKKITTTMIGALKRFEENFGDLWAHGVDEEELTDEEIRWRQIWQLTRTEILNNGNNQIKAASQEISNYTVKFNKFKTNFKIVNRGDNQENNE